MTPTIEEVAGWLSWHILFHSEMVEQEIKQFCLSTARRRGKFSTIAPPRSRLWGAAADPTTHYAERVVRSVESRYRRSGITDVAFKIKCRHYTLISNPNLTADRHRTGAGDNVGRISSCW